MLQLLTVVEFYDVNRIALKYGRVVIFGGDIAATFMSVYNVRADPIVAHLLLSGIIMTFVSLWQLFGPTFPGHYDVNANVSRSSHVHSNCIRQ